MGLPGRLARELDGGATFGTIINVTTSTSMAITGTLNGVSIATTDGRLFVQKIADNSRAARLGLQPGDVIVKVDGKEVASVGELRKLVSAKEKGLVVDITRAGEELKLTEKEK